MNRRDFFKRAGVAAGGAMAFVAEPTSETTYNFKTKHVIWIINGNGSRKKDWYENPDRFPNYARLVQEGFVYEESVNETVANHDQAVRELMTGNPDSSAIAAYPTPLHYIRKAYGDSASKYWMIDSVDSYGQWCRAAGCADLKRLGYGLESEPVRLTAAVSQISNGALNNTEKRDIDQFLDTVRDARLWESPLKSAPIPRDPFVGDAAGFALIPYVLKEFKPRMIVFHQVGHDTGHGDGDHLRKQSGYFEYQKVCNTTDEQLGRILDFVKNDAYFSRNTAIVVRPEFGRDDEVNAYGQLNHSCGYDQTCRSAEIWWGPDFKSGVDKTLKNRMDFVPSITKLFNVNAIYAQGQVHGEMFS